MQHYSVTDLIYLMSRLREPERGCPWDLKQTYKSIVNHSIEEVYELADAIEQADVVDIQGELGDVLFQVIFLARIAEENNDFSFNDVVHSLCEKLLRRHPHVFSSGVLYDKTEATGATVAIDESQVTKNWEKQKKQERIEKNRSHLFDDIPRALPALPRAAKIQKRASPKGFDWPTAMGALQKLKEEVAELETLLLLSENIEKTSASNGESNTFSDELAETEAHSLPGDTIQQRLAEELGDVLFSCVNVARKVGVNSEQALRHANSKFIQRVDAVMAKIASQGLDERVDSEQLDKLWQLVKQEKRSLL